MKILKTKEELLKYGFSNCNKPTLYFCRDLGNEISFNLSITIKTMKPKIDVLDENFLQPYDYFYFLSQNKNHNYAKDVYFKVQKIIKKLVDDNIIKLNKEEQNIFFNKEYDKLKEKAKLNENL